MCTVNGANESLEHIHASELYPKPDTTLDDRPLPFPPLEGEGVSYLDDTSEGVIVLTNYRLFIRYKNSFINLPLGLIESVECRDIFFIHLYCKDARTVRCTFDTNEACVDLYRHLCDNLQPVNKLQKVFAFAHHAWTTDSRDEPPSGQICHCKPSNALKYSFGREVERMGFDLKKAWRISYVNEDFGLCSSYPALHIVPASIRDVQIECSAKFRACRRFPSVAWRDVRSGAVLARCSQPEIGLFGWRDERDELILQAILASCTLNDGQPSPPNTPNGISLSEPGMKKVLIMDARSYTAAVANRAKGGGCECPEYYMNCEIQFMGLANIHSIRKSFYALRTLCSGMPDQQGWLGGVDQTKWLHHISGLMRAALVVVNVIDTEKRPVLVHCSDGWDRTPQIVALAELMLDPYYRTLEGFCVLVQREWLEFGHKFADRCGNGVCSPDSNERCPVFLQWLDCVHQLLKQFPSAFQFNEAVLVKLVQHAYSCLFGTFTCNTPQQQAAGQVQEHTLSVWSLFICHTSKYLNLLYTPGADQVLRPAHYMRSMHLWDTVYLSEMAPMATPADNVLLSTGSEMTLTGDDKTEQTSLAKTRSCDDLSSSDYVEHSSTGRQRSASGRRVSDPNIMTDPLHLLGISDAAGSDISESDSEKEGFSVNQSNGIAENGTLQHPMMDSIVDLRNSLQDGVSMVHGSTDTLTGDLDHDGDKPHVCNGVSSSSAVGEEKPQVATLAQRRSHICTSTSELSDSHVGVTSALDHALHTLTVGHVTYSSSADSTGSTDSDSIPLHSTPSSTNPPTPADKLDNIWPGYTLTSGLSRQLLDVDGLVAYTDPVQLRLAQIENNHQMELQNLQRQLQFARSVLQRYASGQPPDARDDCLGMAGATNGLGDTSGEQGSVEGSSGPSSDVSWEQIDEKDAHMTLWVPDHAVTHCAGCNMQFWIVRRKHHCRNCGQVFCAECTNFYTPVPQQHLDCPVRVCNRCYQLMKTNGHSFILDGASSTMDCLGEGVKNVDTPVECSCVLLRGTGSIADCHGVQSQTNGVKTNGVQTTGDCPNGNGWLDAERRDATLEVPSA